MNLNLNLNLKNIQLVARCGSVISILTCRQMQGATANSGNSAKSVLQAATVQHAGFDPLQQSDHGTVELPNLASVCSGLWAVGSAQDLQHTLTSMPQAPQPASYTLTLLLHDMY